MLFDEPSLSRRLCHDLESIGLPAGDVEIEIRGYSRSYWGRYFPAWGGTPPRVFLYPYLDRGKSVRAPYWKILSEAVHEMCHHIQFTSSGYVRRKGCMHDANFWRLYGIYIGIARRRGLMYGEIPDSDVV